MPGLANAWQALEAEASGSVFQSWSWIEHWLSSSHYPRGTILVRSQEFLVGIGILTLNHVNRPVFGQMPVLSVHENACEEEDQIYIEYNGLLCKLGYEAAVHAAVAKALTENATRSEEFGNWTKIRWPGCLLPTYIGLGEAGFALRLYGEKKAPYVDLTQFSDESGSYLGTRSANTRYQINRSMRLLEHHQSLTITRANTPSAALTAFKELVELHQLTWRSRGRPGAFSNEFFLNFHESFISSNTESGLVDVLHVRSGNNTVGLLYNFLYRNTVYAYQSGFTDYMDSKVKPGLVSHTLAIQYYKKRGMQTYKFLAGNDRYKRSLATDTDTLYWVAMQKPDIQMRIENFLRKVKSVVRSGLRK